MDDSCAIRKCDVFLSEVIKDGSGNDDKILLATTAGGWGVEGSSKSRLYFPHGSPINQLRPSDFVAQVFRRFVHGFTVCRYD